MAVESRQTAAYEKLYFHLWEAAGRYGAFCEFRVIGKSHDERMIPMLEVGRGERVLFCAAGIRGTDRDMPRFLTDMALEYCRAYECGWKMDGIYPVKELLDRVRICFIPMANPDGYEICRQGYSAVRNPVYRQMLQMSEQSCREFSGNARGRDVARNFPVGACEKTRTRREPASENETKSLIRVFLEYPARALLMFQNGGSGRLYYQSSRKLRFSERGLARHMGQIVRYPLFSGKKYLSADGRGPRREDGQGFGSAEEYFGRILHCPAFRLEVPPYTGKNEKKLENLKTLPLEFLYAAEGS